MVDLIWKPSAIEDVNQIAAFIAEDSPRYADYWVDTIFDKVSVLESFPLLGRIVPELEDSTIRELIEGNYRIVYRVVLEKRVEILFIHHSARQFRI